MTKDKNIVRNKTIGFVSLGCDKNRVDLEKIIFSCNEYGLKIENNPQNANIIIVNTCSFIESARVESIDTILEMANYKTTGNLEKLIITGCLNQMNYADLKNSLPEVDAFVKITDNEKILEIICGLYEIAYENNYDCCNALNRIITTDKHVAYLKIADGCDNFCSYCTIPFIRGRYRSVKLEDLIAEAKILADGGVKEIILVAQDVTKYGIDLYGNYKLVELIQHLSKIENIQWIRLLYCYPELVTRELINEIKTNDKVCKYIDLPLQHINNDILKAMNRKNTKEKTIKLINTLRKEIPNINLRSTFILGFPGETEEAFNELITFLKTTKLNYVGFFAYSKEEGTTAATFSNQVPANVKNKRVKFSYKVQEEILKNNYLSLEDKTFLAIIDYIDLFNKTAIARSEFLTPNVDPVIYINNINNDVKVGDFVKIKIKKYNKELEGELIYELTK